MEMSSLKSITVCCVVILTGPSAIAQNYVFTKVADSVTHDFDPSATGAPSISDLGHVAFGTLSSDQTSSRVLRSGPGLAGPLTTIGDDSIHTEIGSFFLRPGYLAG
jgi:hypothetical protein